MMHGATTMTKPPLLWQVQDDVCNILETLEVTAVSFSEITELLMMLSDSLFCVGGFIYSLASVLKTSVNA